VTIVWVWLGLSLLGVAVSGFLSYQSLLDLRSLPASVNGRRAAARSRLAREFLRVTVHVGYILAALGVLMIVPGLRPFVVPFLVYGNAALVANSLIDTTTRHLLKDTRETDVQREDREAGEIRRGQ
jgi:hypothetical protein